MLNSASQALQQAESGVKRKQEARTIGRRIEEVELFLKKAKRELRLARADASATFPSTRLSGMF